MLLETVLCCAVLLFKNKNIFVIDGEGLKELFVGLVEHGFSVHKVLIY
jgi:hypothetical protein